MPRMCVSHALVPARDGKYAKKLHMLPPTSSDMLIINPRALCVRNCSNCFSRFFTCFCHLSSCFATHCHWLIRGCVTRVGSASIFHWLPATCRPVYIAVHSFFSQSSRKNPVVPLACYLLAAICRSRAVTCCFSCPRDTPSAKANIEHLFLFFAFRLLIVHLCVALFSALVISL